MWLTFTTTLVSWGSGGWEEPLDLRERQSCFLGYIHLFLPHPVYHWKLGKQNILQGFCFIHLFTIKIGHCFFYFFYFVELFILLHFKITSLPHLAGTKASGWFFFLHSGHTFIPGFISSNLFRIYSNKFGKPLVKQRKMYCKETDFLLWLYCANFLFLT